jgi:hypothetical protein
MINEIFKRWQVSALGSLIIIICLGHINETMAVEPGEQEFNNYCGICHTIGNGKLIGPDLAGVNSRLPQEWLVEFIKSSQSLIMGGDAYAIALYEEYNKIVMPPTPVAEEKIIEILDYIKFKSANLSASSSGVASDTMNQSTVQEPAKAATEQDILLGQDLFQGLVRFENGGTPCNACHHVKHDAVIGGGILAIELTQVFSKLGGTGVQAILSRAPFPVMEIAYKNKVLTENEIFALVSFLQNADTQHAFQKPRDYGTGLLFSGLVGSTILFGFYSLLWLRRKKGSVNQEIYDRQIKST